MKSTWWRAWRIELARAFAVTDAAPLSPEQLELLDAIAARVSARGLCAPALLALAACEPLGFVGSQAMYALAPLIEPFVPVEQYRRLCVVLARRDGVRAFIQAIERAAAQP